MRVCAEQRCERGLLQRRMLRRTARQSGVSYVLTMRYGALASEKAAR